MPDILTVRYAQTGKSTADNAMGMREMQARAYEKRDAQYLLIKAPPASGKSRALMFLAGILHEWTNLRQMVTLYDFVFKPLILEKSLYKQT